MLTTGEDGSTASFTVVLASAPGGEVRVPVVSGDPSEGTVASAELVFDVGDWADPQTVTITGQDDALDDGDAAYVVQIGPTDSDEPGWSGLDWTELDVVNVDDDGVGVFVTPLGGLVVDEGGATDAFTVVLATQPSGTVVIGVAAGDPSEGAVSPGSLLFDGASWQTPQTVTVTGLDDALDDGDVDWRVVLSPATGSDQAYLGLDPTDVGVTTLDDGDGAGLIASPSTGLLVDESGASDSFTLALQSEPTADVVVDLTVGDPTEGVVSPTSLTFGPGDWQVPQTVTVTGLDDAVDDGDVTFAVLVDQLTSDDPAYDDVLLVATVAVDVTNLDDDSAGVTVTPTSLTVAESGMTATFEVVLDSAPAANVFIVASAADVTEGLVSPPAATFSGANWDQPVVFTVTGLDDLDDDGDVSWRVELLPASSADPLYEGLDPTDVLVTTVDDDQAVGADTGDSGSVDTEVPDDTGLDNTEGEDTDVGDPKPDGCQCATGGVPSTLWLVLPLMGMLRRRR